MGLPLNHKHPYMEFERTPLWGAVEKGIQDLIDNQDLVATEHREYIVGYLCKIITRRKKTILKQLENA